MSNFAYFLFEFILFLISTGSLLAYHLIKERADLMEFSVKVPSKIEKTGNIFILVFFVLGVSSFYLFNSENRIFSDGIFIKLVPMMGIYFLFGFLPTKSRSLTIFKGFLEFVVLFCTVGFLNLSIALKIQMYLIIGLFLVYKQPSIQRKYEVPVYCQMITTSLIMFATSLLISNNLKAVLQLGGIIFSVMFIVLPFQKIYQVSVKLNQYFINLFQGFLIAISLYLISEGNVGACFVLLSYPLFEMCFAIFLKIYNLLKKQKAPCLMMDILDVFGSSDFDKGMFVFRRNILFGALFLFVMYVPGWQFQVVLLTVIIYLKFAVSYVVGPSSNASFRTLFKDMKNDIKKSISETEYAWNRIKQRKDSLK